MRYVEFVLTSDASQAKAATVDELEANKFRLTWADEANGLAERGSKLWNAVAGAAAQYFKVGVRVAPGADGQSTVRLEQLSSGWLGGAIGAARTRRNLARLRDDLASTFSKAGVLVSVTET
jgi:hypothetical protein